MASTAPAPDAASPGRGRPRQAAIFPGGVAGRKPDVPVDPDWLAEAARKKLSVPAWAYVAGGVGAERTMAANRAAFVRWRIVPRMLRRRAARSFGGAVWAAAAGTGGSQPYRRFGDDAPRGADVFKALALRATAVGLGRPYVYGLALVGQRGVRAVLDNLLADFDLTLGLAGCTSVAAPRPRGRNSHDGNRIDQQALLVAYRGGSTKVLCRQIQNVGLRCQPFS